MSTQDTAGLIDRAVRAAVRAPSVHNTQPWRFVTHPRRIELYLDRERILPVADPDGREAVLSCGAALLNLRVALRTAGRGVLVDLVPDRDRPDLLATVRIGGSRATTPELTALAVAIGQRSSNRRPFVERAVPMRHKRALVRAAEQEHAELVLLDTPHQFTVLATLLRRADHLQEEDPEFQAELREWTVDRAGSVDGVPRSAGGPRPVGGQLLRLRQYPHAGSTVERPFEQDPLLAVVASADDSVRELLRAGQAMQRVLLVATGLGLSASFLSQPVEVPMTRAALRELLGHGRHPQAVLRIGYGHRQPPTPRRPTEAVTTAVAEDEESS